MSESVRDAEVFLNESTNFHRFLSNDTVGEEKISELQQRLTQCKEKYEENSKVNHFTQHTRNFLRSKVAKHLKGLPFLMEDGG